MYLDDLASLLERQRALLERRSGTALFFALPTYLATLQSHAPLVAHLSDLRAEAYELGRLHVVSMGEADAFLDAARDAVAALGPFERDESLEGGRRTSMSTRDVLTLYGLFHEPALLALDPADRTDLSRTSRLIRGLDEHLSRAQVRDRRPDLSIREIRPRLADAAAKQQTRLERFIAAANGHAGVALLRLEALVHLVTVGIAENSDTHDPEPELQIIYGPESSVHVDVRAALYPNAGGHLDRPRQPVTEFEGRIKETVELLHTELLGRLGTTRSRLALVDRYCARAEVYDRERLKDLTDSASRPEDRLRDDLALYLFDEGLNPLIEVRFGVARTDIVDPSLSPGFLVEAKQYGEGTSPASSIKGALRQSLDTAQRLHGTYEVEDVFIVLFRRGGPHIALPREPLVVSGRRFFFRLADIADAEVTASRQSEDPVRIEVDALEELFAEAVAEREQEASEDEPAEEEANAET